MSAPETATVDRSSDPPAPRRLRRLLQRALLATAERLLWSDSPRRLATLIFHRVFTVTDPYHRDDVDLVEFTTLMSVIRERFTPLSLTEGHRRLMDGTLPPRAVCVTFDDGYADNLLVAAPVLERLGISATIFVASGYLDGKPMWNDRIIESVRCMPPGPVDLRHLGLEIFSAEDTPARVALANLLIRRLKYTPSAHREEVADALAEHYAPDMRSPMMSRKQVRQLRAEGMEIGGHTLSHPILARTDDATAYREIAENKEDLEGLLGERLSFFAYPNGKPEQDFAPIHAQMVRKIGYSAALTTRHGVATAATDPFHLPRFTPWDRTPTRFALRLLLNMRNTV